MAYGYLFHTANHKVTYFETRFAKYLLQKIYQEATGISLRTNNVNKKTPSRWIQIVVARFMKKLDFRHVYLFVCTSGYIQNWL